MTTTFLVSHIHFGVWESGIPTLSAARESLRQAEQVIGRGYSIYRESGPERGACITDGRCAP